MEDQVGRRQTDRSRNRKRTRARGTEITAGMASEDEWTTFFARRQVAAIEMRVGQNGGPLPFEASFESLRPIVNNLRGVVTKLLATVRDAFALNWQHCGPQFCNRRTSKRFLQQNGVYSGHVSGVFCNSCYADGHEAETDAIEGLCKVWTQPGRAGRKGILLDAGPSGNDVGGVATRGTTMEMEAEGNEVKLPVKEPRTATTL
jgi:hypothetical protein